MALRFFFKGVTEPSLPNPTSLPFQKKKKRLQPVHEEMSLKIGLVLFVALSQSEERKYFFENRC